MKSRKELLEEHKANKNSDSQMNSVYEQLRNAIISADTTHATNEEPTIGINQTLKTTCYLWVRLYLNEEDTNSLPEDIVSMHYIDDNEKVNLKFVCYAKSGTTQEVEEAVVNYNSEDDKKVLCLMIDEEVITKDNNLHFMKTIFKTLPTFQRQFFRPVDLIFKNERTGVIYDYFSADF